MTVPRSYAQHRVPEKAEQAFLARIRDCEEAVARGVKAPLCTICDVVGRNENNSFDCDNCVFGRLSSAEFGCCQDGSWGRSEEPLPQSHVDWLQAIWADYAAKWRTGETMDQYTEIIRATEVAGCPVSVHLSPDAPDWLVARVTAFVRALASAETHVAEADPVLDAFEEAMGALVRYLGRIPSGPTMGLARMTTDVFTALDERLRKLEGRG
jgi:hypothetical protein